MNSITKRTITLGVVFLALLLLSLSTSIVSADQGGNHLQLSVSNHGDVLTIQAVLTTKGLPDGSIVRFHFDVTLSDHKCNPNKNKPGTPVYSGDVEAKIMDSVAVVTHNIPIKEPGYYLIVVTAYDASGNFLASYWIDPREGTGP
jgi:hypothetical protein